MKNIRLSALLIFTSILSIGCGEDSASIDGNIDYMGDTPLIIEESPIHYKYAPLQQDTINVDANGDFQYQVIAENQTLRYILIEDNSYPVVINDNQELNIQIRRADFPQGVTVEGYEQAWDQNYQQYLQSIDGLSSRISEEVEKSKNGTSNNLTDLSQQKVDAAHQYLFDTPLKEYYWKALGEHLVYKIRTIEYNGRHLDNFDSDSARKAVFAEAKTHNFFTIESLKAQRAGIRDFAHYYARTFGIYDSVKAAYGMDLSEYDIKQLAYEELNEKRLQVLDYIESRDALAHARMYLVAERIGEQGIEIAKPSYEDYLEEFQDYPEYTELLTWFYNEIKSVSPGQPAVPFALPDREGDMHTMEDYRGKFVLLDFWAGWCQPCLDEFPHMKDIYQEYSRDELEIIGISNEADSLVWLQDINRLDLPWPQLYGGDGFQEETFKAYKGGGIPFYVLVDPDGNIARYNDIRPSFNFRTVLDSLLSTRQHMNQ
ncbi:TlpA family protein disulfide reductase [Gracilimonas mengyeensis]|uniref:Peroxiredoxin n=1 Tax=Gracilimonas mengyeensis TaxID=1302730 RepID=A0A521DQC0_9BACT|nr:TlpA disulfide reductase family protein [Gracilimonas mengyeensis]SMO73828.1 Peroxiredoxin [Gracilimonas mengyeensis]